MRRTKNGVTSLVMLIGVLGMADIADRRDLAFNLDRSPEAASRLVIEPSKGKQPLEPAPAESRP